ncbi:M56 family metallopeptidase [Longitalea arenae]|uniref:M56 family metallopeptidase n=1 Tax=Longitalea arenae TaxID=2812558 RepID=UPI0019680DCE|nr:M56 family metallopeptidase [Longitalea arenae]
MNLLYQSAFLKALGWSLLNSLWQMALLWLVYVALTRNGQKLLSRQRHTLALLTLAGGSLWFLVTLVLNLYEAANGPQVITLYVENDNTAPHTWPGGFISQWFEPALPFLSLAYLLAAAFLFVRFYLQYRHTQQLFTKGLQKADAEWRIFLQQAVQHLGIKKKVQIWLSNLVDTPVTLGIFKPVILLPVAAVNHLSLKQAEAIILHELNHIRRNDYLVNLLIACVDVILFFNPFARLLTAIIRKERENCCDDLVLQFRYEPQTYARALLSLEQNRAGTSALALAATGKDKFFLLNRVKRILGNEPVSNPFSHRLVAYLLSTLLIAFIGWYNPGYVIVKKLKPAPAQPMAFEAVQVFTTPPMQGRPVQTAKEPAATDNEAAAAETQYCQKDPCTEPKDDYKKLEQLIELTADAKLAALSKELEELPEQLDEVAAFVNNAEAVAYSLPESAPAPPSPMPQQVFPYVPGNSFYFQAVEDSSVPKKYIKTVADLKAKEAMEKSMQALQQVNWEKLEEVLKAQGMTIDISQVQQEIQNALQQIDWKQLNAATENAMAEANTQIQNMRDAYIVRLGNYQRERALQQEKIKQAQQQILLDRLMQHEQLRKLEKEKKLEQEKKKKCTKPCKKKKIVQI